MNPSSLFIFSMLVMLMFNVVYGFASPTTTFTLIVGAVTGFIATIILVGVVSGIQILGSGLNSASIKILFGVGTILNLLFQVSIAGFPVGLGLATTMINAFNSSELFGLGFLITTILCVMTLASGLMVVIGE